MKKISRFEYAIMSIADPENLADYEPITESEDLELRKEKLMGQAKDLRIVEGEQSL